MPFLSQNFYVWISYPKDTFYPVETRAVRDLLRRRQTFVHQRTTHLLSIKSAIMLETGNIERFPKVGNYTSYCRCTGSKCSSNGKVKGRNNAKNGNKYLSWALVEVATQAIMHYKEPNKFYQRKKAKRNSAVAIKAVAAKMSKAIYYMLKDDQAFDMKRVFP